MLIFSMGVSCHGEPEKSSNLDCSFSNETLVYLSVISGFRVHIHCAKCPNMILKYGIPVHEEIFSTRMSGLIYAEGMDQTDQTY